MVSLFIYRNFFAKKSFNCDFIRMSKISKTLFFTNMFFLVFDLLDFVVKKKLLKMFFYVQLHAKSVEEKELCMAIFSRKSEVSDVYGSVSAACARVRHIMLKLRVLNLRIVLPILGVT